MEKYSLLRSRMREKGILQKDIAEILKCHINHISNMLNGKAQFTLKDQYRIMDILEWPYDRMNELFPKNGIYVEPKPKDEVKEWHKRNRMTPVPNSILSTMQALMKDIATAK